MQFGKLQLKTFCFLFPSQRGLEFNCSLFFPDYKSARQDRGSFMCLFFLFNFILMSSTAVDTVQPMLHAINKCKQDITGNSELGVKFCVALLPLSNIQPLKYQVLCIFQFCIVKQSHSNSTLKSENMFSEQLIMTFKYVYIQMSIV